MMRIRIIPAATMLLLALFARGVGAQEEAVAIVVHPATEVDDLTFNDLKSIFRGDRQFWDDGRRVTLLIRAPEAEERRMILERIYVASGPKLVYSADMARDLVTVIPGAITFVPVSQVSSDTKVVRIDGLLPSDEGYPLR
jgi:hypothetical protein